MAFQFMNFRWLMVSKRREMTRCFKQESRADDLQADDSWVTVPV